VFIAVDGTRTFQAFTREGQAAWNLPLAGASVTADHTSTAYVSSTAPGAPAVRALDATTGQERWAVPAVEEVRAARPDAIALLAPGPPTEVVVRDPATGARRWAQPLPSATTSVSLAGDLVVTVSETPGAEASTPLRTAVAYDVATGEPHWTVEMTDAGATWVVDDVVLVWSTDDTTSARRVADGTERWRRPGRPLVRPGGGGGAAADGLVYLANAAGDTDVRVVELASGTERWRTAASDLRQQALGAGSGLLLFLTGRQGVEAVDMATGGGRWSFDWPPDDKARTSAVTVSPDLVFVTPGWTGT
jgi:hypothetical protein